MALSDKGLISFDLNTCTFMSTEEVLIFLRTYNHLSELTCQALTEDQKQQKEELVVILIRTKKNMRKKAGTSDNRTTRRSFEIKKRKIRRQRIN